MKAAIIRFPGPTATRTVFMSLNDVFKVETHYVWHKETSLDAFDLIVLPGGFSYGDYLRCGAIARFSPVMQIGEGIRRRRKKENTSSAFATASRFSAENERTPARGADPQSLAAFHLRAPVCARGRIAESSFHSHGSTRHRPVCSDIPIAHGEGNYVADDATLEELNRDRAASCSATWTRNGSAITDAANPNGSVENIAGIVNARGNVFGLMPHPERACDPRLGSDDGRVIFESIITSLGGSGLADLQEAALPTTSRSLT